MTVKTKSNGSSKRITEAEEFVKLKPINTRQMRCVIKGTSPLIQHKWSEKALIMMREKGSGKKTKDREARNPEAESEAATYRDSSGNYAIPVLALKSAIISAAHKDIGIEKTLVRKALFIKSNPDMMLPMQCSEPVTREDSVRVGQGSADLRYRPQFDDWSVEFTVEIDADLLQPSDVVNLIDRAGFGVGIGEWRPEKGGEYGRFQVETV